MKSKKLKLVIDLNVLAKYEGYYFSIHKKAKKKPIPHPYHESINTWMIMKRPQMNALKQKWKDFIVWYMEDLGYSNLGIKKCSVEQTVYYNTRRKHDLDNTTPKFILDGFVESGFLVSDDSTCVSELILKCNIDPQNPRTEFIIRIFEIERKDDIDAKEKSE